MHTNANKCVSSGSESTGSGTLLALVHGRLEPNQCGGLFDQVVQPLLCTDHNFCWSKSAKEEKQILPLRQLSLQCRLLQDAPLPRGHHVAR